MTTEDTTQNVTVSLETSPEDCAFARCIRWDGKLFAISNTDHGPLFPGRKVEARLDHSEGLATIIEVADEQEEATKIYTELRWKLQQAEATIGKLRHYIKNQIIAESANPPPAPTRWKFIQDEAWNVLADKSEGFVMRVLKILHSWGIAATVGGDVSGPAICILDWSICKRDDGSWAMFKGDWSPGRPEITLSCADEDKITDVYLAGLILDTIRKETEQHRPSNSEDLGQH